jgi:hypothetical protein
MSGTEITKRLYRIADKNVYVLAVAARECQIVIFTCVPERYAFIGEAAGCSTIAGTQALGYVECPHAVNRPLGGAVCQYSRKY